jgi:hypothetical protein
VDNAVFAPRVFIHRFLPFFLLFASAMAYAVAIHLFLYDRNLRRPLIAEYF